MKFELFLVTIFVLNVCHSEDFSNMSSGQGKNQCRSPAVCISIRQCEQLYSLLRNPNKAEIKLLRRLHCGFHGDIPKVCCSNLDSRAQVDDTIADDDISRSTSQLNLLPKTFQCGEHYAYRIFGGRATSLEDFPWLALTIKRYPDGSRRSDCGGALINRRYILTAAHCMTKRNASEKWKLESVRLGEYDKSSRKDCIKYKYKTECHKSQPITVDIDSVIPHEKFSPKDPNSEHDIGLLRLKHKVDYTDYIKPICLPVHESIRKNNYGSRKLTIAGWGLTETNFSSSVKLKVKIPVEPISICRTKFTTEITDKQLCAGGEEGENACMGDSGGPLMAVDSEGPRKLHNWYAVGVLSYGTFPCGLENYPSIYTRVSKYMGWILRHIKP